MDLDATLAKHGNRLGEIERFVERVKALIDGEPSPLQQTAIEEFEGLVAFKSEFESALPELRKAIADVAVVIDDMGKIKSDLAPVLAWIAKHQEALAAAKEPAEPAEPAAEHSDSAAPVG